MQDSAFYNTSEFLNKPQTENISQIYQCLPFSNPLLLTYLQEMIKFLRIKTLLHQKLSMQNKRIFSAIVLLLMKVKCCAITNLPIQWFRMRRSRVSPKEEMTSLEYKLIKKRQECLRPNTNKKRRYRKQRQQAVTLKMNTLQASIANLIAPACKRYKSFNFVHIF